MLLIYTLVVDVTSFNDKTWFDRAGNHHSDALHLVERFTLVTPDVINYEVTIEDPMVFTRPWKIAMPLYRRMEPNIQLLEYRCTEFVEEFLYGHVRGEPLERCLRRGAIAAAGVISHYGARPEADLQELMAEKLGSA